MKQFIDFYMVTISPWCYLSLSRLALISDKYNIEVKIKPIDLFALFKKYGTKGLKERPLPVRKNRINELKRWSKFLNISLNEQPKFHPVNPEFSSKIIIASILYDNDLIKSSTLTFKLCEAVWVKNLDVSNKKTLTKIADASDINENAKKSYLEDKKVSQIYNQNTLEAINSNVFGVPSFIFNNQLYFGQDRIFMLEEAIKKST